MEVHILRLFVLFFPLSLFAGEAVITGHRVPLFKSPSINSEVIQWMNKGDIIFIHDKELGTSPLEPQYERGENGPMASNRIKKGDVFTKSKKFYETLHKLAGPAYVLGKHVKIIYKDTRENSDPIDQKGIDFTDYRLKEPLREGYPLTKEDDVRASLYVGMGNQRRNHYPYSSQMLSQDYSTRYTLHVLWLNNVNFDPYNRYFYGWDFHFHNEKKTFLLADGRESVEDGGQFYFGPTLNFDGARGDLWRLSFQTTFGMTWTRILINQKSSEGKDQNLYQAFSFSPKASLSYHRLKVIRDIDFVAKAEAQYELSHSLNPSSQNGDTTYWQEGDEDSIRVPSGARITLYLGIQNSF